MIPFAGHSAFEAFLLFVQADVELAEVARVVVARVALAQEVVGCGPDLDGVIQEQIEELNRDFKRFHKASNAKAEAPATSANAPNPTNKEEERFRRGSKADRLTIQDLLQYVPSGGSIQFSRSNNFAGFPFDWDSLSDFRRFLEHRSGPDHEFIDTELEVLRRDFRDKSSAFMRHLAKHTFRLSGATGESRWSSVPGEWEYQQPRTARIKLLD